MESSIAFLYPAGRPYYPPIEAISLIPGYSPVFITDNDCLSGELKLEARCFKPGYTTLLTMPGRGSARIAFIKSLEEVFDRFRPSVVVTYEVFSSLSYQAARLKRKRDFTHIVFADDTVSIDRATWGKFPLTRIFARYVAQNADLFIAHSQKARNSLLSTGVPGEDITQMYLGIFLSPFLELGRNSGKGSFDILYLGQLRKNKGIETLVNAFRSMADGKNARLVIAGTGPIKDVVEHAAAEDSRIVYEGYVTEERKMKLLETSDVFVYPSEDMHFFGTVRWEEQAGISVMEAMAAGMPVIGSNSGALGEVIGREDMVVPQRDPSALADKMSELKEDDARSAGVGEFNRRRSVEQFDISEYARKLRELIAERT